MQPCTFLHSRSTFLSGARVQQCQGLDSSRVRRGHGATQALFGWGKDPQREAEREEMWKAQQEVIARRKAGKWQQEVAARRADATRYARDKEYKKKVDDERKKNRPVVEDPPINPFSIIIPINPIGIPEYDEGERFDLKAPYVDNGWVDEDSGIFSSSVAKLFGYGKKNKKGTREPPTSKRNKK